MSAVNSSRILGTVGVPAKPMFNSVYMASVINNNDPLGEGRVTLYVPQVLGTATSNWAKPLGYTPISIPPVGAMVHAYFNGGDINHPIYIYTASLTGLAADVSTLTTQVAAVTPSSWMTPTLNNGWTNTSGSTPAQFRVVSTGILHVVGHLTGTTINTTIATLPSGYYSATTSNSFPANIISGGSSTQSGGVLGETDQSGVANGDINGTSDTDGLSNGDINGTSGSASAGTAHTHGGGSYAVASGQHSHGPGSYALGSGLHQHTLTGASISVSQTQTSANLTLNTSGQVVMSGAPVTGGTFKISFNAMVPI